MTPLSYHVQEYVLLAALLFCVGGVGFLVRRNLLIQLMCVELMLNATNLVLVAFNRLYPESMAGQVFAFFVIAVAAAEAAVGLAIAIGFFRLRDSVHSDDADTLRH
jgi:NADH-quinone oxidoreductase subunit K